MLCSEELRKKNTTMQVWTHRYTAQIFTLTYKWICIHTHVCLCYLIPLLKQLLACPPLPMGEDNHSPHFLVCLSRKNFASLIIYHVKKLSRLNHILITLEDNFVVKKPSRYLEKANNSFIKINYANIYICFSKTCTLGFPFLLWHSTFINVLSYYVFPSAVSHQHELWIVCRQEHLVIISKGTCIASDIFFCKQHNFTFYYLGNITVNL